MKCFPSKGPASLQVLFNIVVKHYPVIVMVGLDFVSEENEDKILKVASVQT